MPAVVRHPSNEEKAEITNDGFFPTIELSELRKQYGVDDRVAGDELKRLLEGQIMRVNESLADWSCTQIRKGYATLDEVPAAQVAEVSTLVLSYGQAIGYGVKASVIRNNLNYDLTRTGEGEAKEKEDQAQYFAAEAQRALRRILGRKPVRVKRIVSKKAQRDWPVDFDGEAWL